MGEIRANESVLTVRPALIPVGKSIHVLGLLDDEQVRDVNLASGPQGEAPYALSVGPVRMTDLVHLIRPPEFVMLNEPRIEGGTYVPFRAALSAIAPGRGRPKFFVARSSGGLLGFAHFQQCGPDRRWQGVAMGAATGVYGAGPAWEELLRHVTIAAGLKGVKRMFVKAPAGFPFLDAFKRVNYSAYATETIFMLEHLGHDDDDPPARRQQPYDAWAIQQLYNAVTPKQVQYAEAWTSDRWNLKPPHAHQRVSAWVLEEGSQIMGLVRVTSVGGAHGIELLHHPRRPQLARDLIIVALAKLRKTAKIDCIWCTVRGYQAEAATALENRGFEPVMEQDLLISYTTATARAPQIEGMPFSSELIERLPKRAPSFPYNSARGDRIHS